MLKSMLMDVVELREFYASRLGSAVENSVSMALSSVWGTPQGERLLGLGYPVPWLDRFSPDAECSVCLMPAAQGAMQWPSSQSPCTALTYDDQLPLPDGSIDRVLMVHFLEHAENAAECVAEAWRVLSPGGTLIIVAPNRRGVWARFEHTPFGTGKPYSRGQLDRLLRDNQFTAEQWSDALHFPPSNREIAHRLRSSVEGFGRRVWPIFAGVICVSATKRLYQGIPVTARAKRRVAVPVLVPQGNVGRSNREKR